MTTGGYTGTGWVPEKHAMELHHCNAVPTRQIEPENEQVKAQ